MTRTHTCLIPFVLMFALLSGSLFARGQREETLPLPEPPSQQRDAELLPLDDNLTTGTLDNGLSYYLRPNSEPENRIFLRLVVDAGSILERDDELGLAHFVEHAAFLGTEEFSRDQIVTYLESLGMRFGPEINAYTGFDETVYMLQVPADDPEKIERGVHILQQWAHAISFQADDVNTERGVIQEEWRQGLGAQQRFRDKQFPILFQDSRYAERLPIGDPAVFMESSAEDLRDFYARWYRPELMSVVAVGDFDTAAMEELIGEYFSVIPEPEDPAERTLYPVPEHDNTLFAPFSDPEAGYSRTTVYNKQAAQPQHTESDYRQSLTHRIFAGIMNDRFDEISRQSDAPFLGAGAARTNLVRTASGTILQVVTDEAAIAEGFEALLVEAVRARQHGFSEAEIERARQRLLRSMQTAYNERTTTPSSRFVEEYTRHFLAKEAAPGIKFEWELTQRLLPQITAAEVNHVATEYLAKQNRVVTVSAAESEKTRLPGEDQLQEILTDVTSRSIPPRESDSIDNTTLLLSQPAAGEIVSETLHDDTQTIEWELSNGITVLIRPTDFRSDDIRLQALQQGGHSLSEDEDIYSAYLAAPLAEQSGVAHLDRTQLDHFLAGKDVRLSPYLDTYTHGFSGASSADDLETMLQLLHAYTVSPRLEKDTYDFLIRQVQVGLERQQDQPDAVFANRLQEILADGTPRHLPLTPADVMLADFATARDIYLDRFADLSETTITLVGTVAADELRPLVEQYLASLPGGRQDPQRLPHPVYYPDEVVRDELRFGQEDASRSALVFRGEFSGTRQADYSRIALTEVLRIHLREVLREELGSTYGVGVSSGSKAYPEPYSTIRIAFSTDPEMVGELTERIHREIAHLQTEGPRADILQRAAETHRRDFEENLRSNRWWLAGISQARYQDRPLESILDRPGQIESLDADMIRQAAQDFLPRDAYIQLIMYPGQE